MKVSIFAAFIFLFPLCANSQEISSAQTSPVVNHKEAAVQKYQIVTPVLLRESSSLNLQDEYAIQDGSKFQSFFSSLVIPGSGQIRNQSWWKAGIFMAVEVASVYLFVDLRNDARTGEREYEKWANRNWSVVQYSNWLVQYHDINNLDNPHIDNLRDMLDGEEATYNVQTDWQKVDLDVLNDVERNTPYITSDSERANNFSHTLPQYGSQQYYELISKYYQYQAGWKDYDDFHNAIGNTGPHFNDRYQIDRGGAYASPFFYQGAQMGNAFNTDFRRSGYFVSLLIANHLISAFDAYFTLKMKQNRLRAASSIVPGKQLTLTYRF